MRLDQLRQKSVVSGDDLIPITDSQDGNDTKNIKVSALASSGFMGDKSFVHNQISPQSVWNIYHGMNKKPSVTIVDSGGTVVHMSIRYINNNHVRATSEVGAFSGKAYLN